MGAKVLLRPQESPQTATLLTGAEANESLFPSIKASDPPFIYRAKIFAINTA